MACHCHSNPFAGQFVLERARGALHRVLIFRAIRSKRFRQFEAPTGDFAWACGCTLSCRLQFPWVASKTRTTCICCFYIQSINISAGNHRSDLSPWHYEARKQTRNLQARQKQRDLSFLRAYGLGAQTSTASTDPTSSKPRYL